jgi:hypothetical protein
MKPDHTKAHQREAASWTHISHRERVRIPSFSAVQN